MTRKLNLVRRRKTRAKKSKRMKKKYTVLKNTNRRKNSTGKKRTRRRRLQRGGGVYEDLEKKYERASSTPRTFENAACKVGGEAANFWCPFFSFGGVRLARS